MAQPHNDGDPDDALKKGTGLFDKDDRWYVGFGRAATPAELRAIQQTLVGYYAAVEAADGKGACQLVYSLTAETVAEEHGQLPSPSGLSPQACASVFSKLFAQIHRLYARKPATTLHVDRFRVAGPRGIAFIDFGGSAIRMMPVHLQDGGWKVREIIDLTLG